MEFKSDIQIAQETAMTNISALAAQAGIDEQYLELYGKYKAKIDYKLLKDKADVPDGKLVLVTAISPTPAGEGKTTKMCIRDRLRAGTMPAGHHHGKYPWIRRTEAERYRWCNR